ncbi:polysaccharide pyruvyl transferase family protein [Microbulbifer sp. SA54]|uniref:polysaccharide pyruvyl transferase family protein n=1 Tax=Microbulbifer sp. SA54 TaxID=3401577 RepID=UPI003AACD494
MSDSIRLHFYDGFYSRRDPLKTLANLFRYRKLYQPVYNIGDQISPYVVSGMSGRKVNYSHPFSSKKMIAIGSVLAGIRDEDVAWGTGLMRPDHAPYVLKAKNARIVAVRGPNTRAALLEHGLDCPEVYGDPGLLMPYLFQPNVEKRYRVGVIPHGSHLQDLEVKLEGSSYALISPRLHWREFIEKICASELIVSSSLHGVILADAYGVPNLPLRHNKWLHGTPFKFEDYYLSTRRSPEFFDSSQLLDKGALQRAVAAYEAPRLDLRPLVNAFPYPVKNEDFLRRLNSVQSW